MNLGRYEARDADGHYVGVLEVALDDDGVTPRVVRDEHGSTWLFVRESRIAPNHYERVRCADAWLWVVK